MRNKSTKSFTLTQASIDFLETVDRKSALIDLLLENYRKGFFLQPETCSLLTEFMRLYGEVPEESFRKFLRKKIDKMKVNRVTLKEMIPELVKNRTGGAFIKLDRAYEALVDENLALKENPVAITFNQLFKKTGCNQLAIRRWLNINRERVDLYHQSLGIDDPQIYNRHLGVIHRVQKQRDVRHAS